jgi:hypothetical protein
MSYICTARDNLQDKRVLVPEFISGKSMRKNDIKGLENLE